MREQQEEHFLTKGFGYLKNALFEVVACSLEHNVVNGILYMLFVILELVQTCPFFLVLCFQTSSRDKDDTLRFAVDILNSISLNSSIMSPSFMLVATVTFGFFILSLLIIAGLLHYGSSSSSEKSGLKSYEKTPFLFRCLSLIIVLACKVLTIPMFVIQHSVFNCNSVNGKSVFATDSTVSCWEPLHIAIIIINCVNIVVFIAAIMIFDLLFNEASPKSTIPWACSHANQYKFVKHIWKMILIAFVIFDPSGNFYHYFFIIEIGIIGFCLYIILISPPFVKRIIGGIVFFSLCLPFFLLVETYILTIINTAVTSPVALIIILTVGSLAIVATIALEYHGSHVLSLQVSETKEEAIKETYFYELFKLVDQYASGDPYVYITLFGIYSNHQLTCRNTLCKCRSHQINHNNEEIRKRELQNPTQAMYRRVITDSITSAVNKVYTGLASLFQITSQRSFDAVTRQESVKCLDVSMEKEDTGINNGSLLIAMCTSLIESEVVADLQSVTLRLISAYFYREFIGNILKSVYDLMYIMEKLKPSVRQSFLVYRYRLIVDEEVGEYTKKKSKTGELDVEGITNFEACYEVFRHEAESASYLVNRFWNLLKNKDLDVNGLYDIGSKVGTTYANIYQNYQQALEIFPQSYKLVLELGRFEKYIMNNDAFARNFDIQANQINNEQGEYNQSARQTVFGMDITGHTCICVSSGNPDSIGNVISINSEVFNILGYKAKDVIGQNCAAVCPPYVGVKHNIMIEEFLRRGTSNLLGAHRIVSGYNSRGFLVPLEVVVTMMPCVDDGIKFVAIFRKLEVFRDYFDVLRYNCSEADFAIIVTTEDGLILSINENCMTRLGIVPSLTTSKTDTEPFYINQIIKALAEPDIDNEICNDGKKLEIDTGVLLGASNREALSSNEAKYLEQNAGRHFVFVKMQKENYGRGIVKVKVYRMFILPHNSEMQDCGGATESGKLIASDGTNSQKQIQVLKDKVVTELEKSEADLNDTAGPFSIVKSLNELKQKMNSQGSSFNFVAIKRWVNFVILFVIAIASTQFGFLIVDTNVVYQNEKILNVAHLRFTNVGLIHSQIFMNVLMASTSTDPSYLETLNIYEYLREYGFRSINILSNSEAYMNTIDYDYSDTLYNLEKKGTVSVETLGMNRQITVFSHTINTAITQYNSKASGFMSFEFSYLRNALLAANATSIISTEYYFVKENGIRSLANATKTSINEFKRSIKDRTGVLLPYHIGAAILVGLSLLICFSTILPRLVSIMQEKIDVLMLYTQMNKREIDSQIIKCVEYQKSSGYWIEVDESGHEHSIDGNSEAAGKGDNKSQDDVQSSSPEKQTSRKLVEVKDKEKLNDDNLSKDKAVDGKKEKTAKKEDDENDEDDEDDSDKEEEKNEDEKTIQEQLDTEQLKSKLTTNICSLTVLSILIFIVFCCYSTISTIKFKYSMDNAKSYLDYTLGLSSLINAPLYLSLDTLVSVKENRTIYNNGKDLIDLGLAQFLEANAFIQTLKYSSDPILGNTKDYFNSLDSSTMCQELSVMYSIIKSTYTNSNYTYLIKITPAMCNSFYNGILSKGITQAAFIIHGEINSIQSQRKAKISNISLSNVLRGLNMLQMFLIPAYEGLTLNYMTNLDNNNVEEIKFLVAFFICYLFTAIAVHCIFWSCLLKSVEEELIKSRGMLKIMPIELIGKLKEMKRGELTTENRRVIAFFSKIQKE